MIIRRNYSKPDIEEHFIDQVINLAEVSGEWDPVEPTSFQAPSPSSSPQLENPSAAEYPFGGDSPDFSNM